MNHHSLQRNRGPLPEQLGVAALTAAAILGTTALVNTRRARLAERKNPPAGQFLDIEGVHLHYLERGEGPPLVLLHGNGAMMQDFEISGILDQLAQGYRVIAVDRPGFGHCHGRRRYLRGKPSSQADAVHPDDVFGESSLRRSAPSRRPS